MLNIVFIIFSTTLLYLHIIMQIYPHPPIFKIPHQNSYKRVK